MTFHIEKTRFDTPISLAIRLNQLEDEGWFPLFPIWEGSGIVFTRINREWEQIMENVGERNPVIDVTESEEIERLREP